ncbi:MAG TPA: iron-containing alcohol dehydrogenase [Polyangiaceae bacterium]|nr:iron-containing alcohol dehydrogenase [Polyangiaceae bacterium]
MPIHQYNFPTKIHYGPGALEMLPDVLKSAGKSRPLIVTDRGLAMLPPVLEASALLKRANLEHTVFSGVWGNPVKSQVSAGVEAFRSHGADAIVGLGGGAALDVAKAIALMAHHPGDLFDYEDEKPGARPIDQPIPYWVAVPTTAGTGSEVGRSTVVSDDVSHVKKIMFSPRLLAERVLADPKLTLALPASVTASTGMDALTHLVEAYLAKGFQPLCDGIALQGVRLVSQSLVRAVDYARRIEGGERELLDDERHLEARGLMLNAAMMGGVAFQKGLGVTHSLAHSLSTVTDMHHGFANGIAIPYAMKFNQSAAAERLADLALLVGASDHSPAGFIRWLEELKAAIGIPRSLSEAGVKSEQLDALVNVAIHDACHPNNPRPVNEADFRGLFQAALG